MPAHFNNCVVQKATDKALLIYIDEIGEDKWIPKSVIHDDSEIFDDDENSKGELVILDWFAKKEHLI